MCLTAVKEAEARIELGEDIQSVDTSGAVFSDIQRFKDKKEFYSALKQFGYDATNPYVRFVQVILVGKRREGNSIFLKYRINVFHEYFGATQAEPIGSTAIFNALFINLSNKLDASRNITEDAELFNDDEEIKIYLDDKNDFFKGLYGHHTDFFVEVEVIDC